VGRHGEALAVVEGTNDGRLPPEDAAGRVILLIRLGAVAATSQTAFENSACTTPSA
jgi:hypothetical protein